VKRGSEQGEDMKRRKAVLKVLNGERMRVQCRTRRGMGDRANDRLRLEDQGGNAILDLEKYFREVEVLIFYAGSEQGSSESFVSFKV